jgi:hypothetical protein
MDLTPLVTDRSCSVPEFVAEKIARFRDEVLGNLR